MEDAPVTAKAPGKIILSGEHSVVYGKPAIAMAINRFSKTTITKEEGYGIWFEFLDENFKQIVSLEELRVLKKDILKRYRKFLNGKNSIESVILNPLELIQYAFTYLEENLLLSIDHGLKIQIDLDIPIGCGMGASASVILSLIHALVKYFKQELTADKYLYFGKEIENLQHGRSSGLDLFLSYHGGCYIFQNGKAEKRELPNLPLILVNTGSPKSSTGKCVEKAAKYLQNEDTLASFEETTISMDKALQQNDLEKFKIYIKRNNELLNSIGVVPNKIMDFINEIEKAGCAAKISGAGSIKGDKAGTVLIAGENDVSDIIKKYNYEILSVKGEENGLSII